MNNNLQRFIVKVSKILTTLEISQGGDKILKNLLGSLMLNFSRLITSDEKITPLIKSFTQNKDNDPNDLLKFLDSQSVDYNNHFSQAETETMNIFISELEQSIPAEKIAQLRAL